MTRTSIAPAPGCLSRPNYLAGAGAIEAVNKVRITKTAFILSFGRPVALLLTVQLFSGMVLSPQGSFFPIYLEEQLGYTVIFVSAGVAIGRVLGMVASVVGGALSDTLGRKWTFVLGLTGFVFGSLLFLIRIPALVILLWALSGLGAGLHALGGQSYLIDATSPQRLGVVSALYNWGFTLGGALGSPGAGAILDRQGFAPFGLALLTISLATVLGAVAFLPRLPRSSDEKLPSWRDSLRGYRTISGRPVIVTLLLLRFLPTCYYGMMVVLNPLLINRTADSKTAVALYATTSLIMATIAQMLVGRAADRFGHRRPTLITFGILVTAAIAQAVFATHLWSFYTFGILGLSAAWSLSTLQPLLVSDATTARERGRVLGTLHLVWNLGMIVGSLVGGALVDAAVGLPYLATGLLNVGSIFLAARFFRLVRLKTAPDVTQAG